LVVGMTVVAEFQTAQPSQPQATLGFLWGFLRRNEDRVVIAGLVLVIVATTSLATSLSLPANPAEIGVCRQHVPSFTGHVLLTMH
jgi:hypothetical protein